MAAAVIYACTTLGCLCFFPNNRVFLSSRVTGACPVTTDLTMRVNVRTTTTTTMANVKPLMEVLLAAGPEGCHEALAVLSTLYNCTTSMVRKRRQDKGKPSFAPLCNGM